jgi:hypothetical protein
MIWRRRRPGFREILPVIVVVEAVVIVVGKAHIAVSAHCVVILLKEGIFEMAKWI